MPRPRSNSTRSYGTNVKYAYSKLFVGEVEERVASSAVLKEILSTPIKFVNDEKSKEEEERSKNA